MRGYVRLEMLRTLRDPLYAFLAVGAPIGFYLLFSGLFGSSPSAPGVLPENVELMVAMAVFGGIWACLVGTGPRIAAERSSGWTKNLQLLPISPWATLAGRALTAALFALPAILLVCATAVLVHGVHLAGWQWVTVILASWVGVWPFAILGIGLGYLTNVETAFAVTYGVYSVVSALGGLWVPPAIMPAAMLNVGKVLPDYQAADLGWRLANGQAPFFGGALGLAAWTLVFAAFATVFARRAARVR